MEVSSSEYLLLAATRCRGSSEKCYVILLTVFQVLHVFVDFIQIVVALALIEGR